MGGTLTRDGKGNHAKEMLTFMKARTGHAW